MFITTDKHNSMVAANATGTAQRAGRPNLVRALDGPSAAPFASVLEPSTSGRAAAAARLASVLAPDTARGRGVAAALSTLVLATAP